MTLKAGAKQKTTKMQLATRVASKLCDLPASGQVGFESVVALIAHLLLAGETAGIQE